MVNPFEALWDTIKPMVDEEPKPPLHVGEVMNLWTVLTIFEEAHSIYISSLNMTTDEELTHALNVAEKTSKKDIVEFQVFLKKEGVPLPVASDEKPKSDPNDVPLGVKLTDNEIANAVSAKIAACIVLCATGLAESTRTDVGVRFLQYQAKLVTFGASFKLLMRKRSWIKIPPYYYPPGSPHSK
ncbi:DUF3231 family protein [Bacillus sp. 2205SS5-2]|uniref:DUF3231 family protein n=1 Tax=Bacillus sp. 2205SS5-2 TaxID=3109031 RepID=UPI003006E889